MAKQKLTMTLTEVYREMRAAGIPCSPMSISAGIKSGAYPFGRVVSETENRTTFQIFRVDFYGWLETRIPTGEMEKFRRSLLSVG